MSMANQHFEVIDSTLHETHGWLVATAEGSRLSQALRRPQAPRRLNTPNLNSRLQRRTAAGEAGAAKVSPLSPRTSASSSTRNPCFSLPSSEPQRQAVLTVGHVLGKLLVAAIPGVVILAIGVLAIAAFVGGYLAALR
jgi:hypothetical protein